MRKLRSVQPEEEVVQPNLAEIGITANWEEDGRVSWEKEVEKEGKVNLERGFFL